MAADLNETAAAKATAAGQWFVSTAANALAARFILEDTVATLETTTSLTFAALTTAGPIVTITTGTQALCFYTCQMTNNTANDSVTMAPQISGATTTAANDTDALRHRQGGTADDIRATALSLFPLTAGSNTFTALYKVNGGTGSFSQRNIVVMGL